ncbi:hypothetical protein [Paenibacillus sp. YYML68]|uniref:hypothetical protein n=1 Tax=Paenibacillus sp. YYML68 TaxID=2909250 RepID=UPI0024903CE3|nr:hypothetical protein [Paenibacillus sp. YYML68]
MDKEQKETIILKEDFEFEYAKTKGAMVEPRQNDLRIYPAGPITGYSSHHVSINGKKLHRSANTFIVVE